MILRQIMVILLVLGSQSLRAQFMEYKPLPILPPSQYGFAFPSQPSVEQQLLEEKRRRLELRLLKEQGDLLRNLNGNSTATTNPSNLITLTLLGASTSDLQFKPKSDWRKFNQGSSMVVNKATNQVRLYLPDLNQDLTFDVLDIQVYQGDGYSINTLELESDNFISVLNVFNENGLWILWGTKGDPELVVFQSAK